MLDLPFLVSPLVQYEYLNTIYLLLKHEVERNELSIRRIFDLPKAETYFPAYGELDSHRSEIVA